MSWFVWMAVMTVYSGPARAADLDEIQKRGVLVHIGVPYANFVTGSGDGLDVELMKAFARYLNVRYEFVDSTWQEAIADLTGKKYSVEGETVRVAGEVPVKGDVLACGLTILDVRKGMVSFSTPTFPTQVWVVARHDSALHPITPSGDIARDITAVKSLLSGHEIFGVDDTCLAPSLYGLADTGARIKLHTGNLNELVPAIINGDAELSLLEVPDSLVALQKWPGRLKVIGPISPIQSMACAFSKDSPNLLHSFNTFFEQFKKDGSHLRLIEKYYPTALENFSGFFKDFQHAR